MLGTNYYYYLNKMYEYLSFYKKIQRLFLNIDIEFVSNNPKYT